MSFASLQTVITAGKALVGMSSSDLSLSSVVEGSAAYLRAAGNQSVVRPPIRRPMMGASLNEEAPAYITVRRYDGTYVMLNNMLGTLDAYNLNDAQGAGPGEQYYTDFTLLQVQESHEEKFSPQDTFGEDFAFFSGERPSFLQCAGTLVNTRDFQWRSIWWNNYEKYLRGTRCVENRAKVYLSWGDVLVEGYMIQANSTDQATDTHLVPFSFTLYVTKTVSLADLNYEALRNYKLSTANGRSSEILGDRQAAVLANGKEFSFGPGFLERQLEAIFGTQSIEEALAIVARNPDLAARNLEGYLKEQGEGVKNMDTLRALIADPTMMAPLFNHFVPGYNDEAESKLGNVRDITMVGRSGAAKLFGDNYRSTQSLSIFR